MSTMLVLLLGLTVGLPCTLLALAIAYHARAAGRMPTADEGWDPDAEDAYGAAPVFSVPMPEPQPAADSPAEPDPVLLQLQEMVADLQQQLSGQRSAIVGLLSERERAAEAARSAARPTALHTAGTPGGDLRGNVRQLLAEGLSERSIARRLRIGLEEVRLVSRRERVS